MTMVFETSNSRQGHWTESADRILAMMRQLAGDISARGKGLTDRALIDAAGKMHGYSVGLDYTPGLTECGPDPYPLGWRLTVATIDGHTNALLTGDDALYEMICPDDTPITLYAGGWLPIVSSAPGGVLYVMWTPGGHSTPYLWHLELWRMEWAGAVEWQS